MKKTFKYAALALAVMSSQTFAQESSDNSSTYKKWLGFSGMYYSTEETKPSSQGIFDDGAGFGAEFGWRFDQSWAARVEYNVMEMDYRNSFVSSESGHMFGADAMYFLPNDTMYMFGGVRRQIFDQNYNLGNIGLGKHWDIHENVKLVTEIAAYHDFGEDYNDYSVKLGVAFPFGETSSGSASTDSDGDGVMDGRDQCANTPAGTAVDANGCNSDSDGDGVMNNADQCPNTPSGTQVDSNGCPVTRDSDGDRVNDEKDMCPNTPRNDKVDGDGCTVFDQKEVTHTLRVLFASESAKVTDPRSQDIQDFVQFFKRYGKTQAVIEGHASAPGTQEYNMDLSKRRAESFKDVLVNMYDIDPSRLETEGFGENQLLDESNSAEANRINRRIMIRVSAIIEVPEERN